MSNQESHTRVTGERREFQMDRALLWNYIHSQAGSIWKALGELVMNGIDAGSPRLDIMVTSTGFEVSDTGKGFASRKEIDEFFKKFGTPHQEGDARFGKFRMGRGQIMAFARTIWTSGEFRMDVDIKARGMGYELETGRKPADGCHIKGEWYTPLSHVELTHEVRELTRFSQLMGVPVFINGRNIAIDVRTHDWTFEDEDAYYQLSIADRGFLEVFNLGAFVSQLSNYQLGCSGIVLSKKQLTVNFARNAVMSHCEVWKRCSKAIRKWVREQQTDRTVRNEAYRRTVIRELWAGDRAVWTTLLDEPIFTLLNKKHVTARELVDYLGLSKFTVPGDDDAELSLCEALEKQQFAKGIHPDTLLRFDAPSWPALMTRLDAMVQTLPKAGLGVSWKGKQLHTYWNRLLTQYVPLSDLEGLLKPGYTRLEPKALSVAEKKGIQYINKRLRYLTFRGLAASITLGESDVAQHWTDEKGIVLHRSLASRPAGVEAQLVWANKVALAICHELCHQEYSNLAHEHNTEFQTRFEAELQHGQYHYIFGELAI